VPARQGTHATPPLLSSEVTKVPGWQTHCATLKLPCGEVVRAGHSWHVERLSDAILEEKVPALQFVHSSEPTVSCRNTMLTTKLCNARGSLRAIYALHTVLPSTHSDSFFYIYIYFFYIFTVYFIYIYIYCLFYTVLPSTHSDNSACLFTTLCPTTHSLQPHGQGIALARHSKKKPVSATPAK